MPAPRHLIDSLECVVSLFFSNVRHNLRAAFILCDELVEVTCRARVKQAVHKPGRMNFYQHLTHAQVKLDPNAVQLGKTLLANHETRNNMQHENPAATVDVQHCADSIIDAVAAIEHCFPGSAPNFPNALRIALRVTRLFATNGDQFLRASFATAMHGYPWRSNNGKAKKHESVIAPGEKDNWGFIMLREYAKVDAILNQIGAPA